MGCSPQTLHALASPHRAKGYRLHPWWFLTLGKVRAVATLAGFPSLHVCFSCTILCFHEGDNQVPGSQINSKVTHLCLQSFCEEAESPEHSQQEQGLWLPECQTSSQSAQHTAWNSTNRNRKATIATGSYLLGAPSGHT